MKWRNKSLGILLVFLILGMLLLNTESYVSGDPALEVVKGPTRAPPLVSRNVALYLAKNELNSVPFMDFKGAEIGKKMILFYFPDGRPAYYEVPLLMDGKVIGVMFIPASKTMPPKWMQVFKGRELVSQQLDKIAETRGIRHYRYVVLGAAAFGIQTDDGTVVDLAGREYRIDPKVPFRFSIESEKNAVLWAKLERDAPRSSSRKIIEDFYWEAMKLYEDGYLGVHPTYGYDPMNRGYSSDYQLFLAVKREIDIVRGRWVFWPEPLFGGEIEPHSIEAICSCSLGDILERMDKDIRRLNFT